MKLVHQKEKAFDNFYMVWRFEGRLYAVRVRPSFNKDYDKLYALAESIPEDEPIEKYY